MGESLRRKCLKSVRDATVIGGKGRRTGWAGTRAYMAITSTPRGRAMGDTADRPVMLQSGPYSSDLHGLNPQSGPRCGSGIGRVDAACRRCVGTTMPSWIRTIRAAVITG